jgi:hypothetical protein
MTAGLVGRYRRFGGTYRPFLYGNSNSMFVGNAGNQKTARRQNPENHNRKFAISVPKHIFANGVWMYYVRPVCSLTKLLNKRRKKMLRVWLISVQTPDVLICNAVPQWICNLKLKYSNIINTVQSRRD